MVQKKFIAYEKFFGNARSKFSTIMNKVLIHSKNSELATLLSKIQIQGVLECWNKCVDVKIDA